MDFDRDERLIAEKYAAFERDIDVPDLIPGIEQKLRPARRGRRPGRMLVIMAAVVALLVVTAAAAAGSFDWLLGTVKPAFGGNVEPVELSASSQGVEMTVIAAQRFDASAVFYVSVKDTSGQGRMAVDMKPAISVGSMQPGEATTKIVYFDEEAAEAVFEVTAVLREDDIADGKVTLTMPYYSYNHDRVTAELTDFDLAAAAQNGAEVGEPAGSAEEIERGVYLPAGYLADVPGTDVWVSAVGVNSGFAAVQLCWPYDENTYMRYNSPRAYIMRGQRELTFAGGRGGFLNSEAEPVSAADDICGYRFIEDYFESGTPGQLDGCTLVVEVPVCDGVDGGWSVDVDLSSAAEPLTVTRDIEWEGRTITGVTFALSPLSLRISGADPEDALSGLGALDAVVETADGAVRFSHGRGSRFYDTGEFCLIGIADQPIDVSTATAVVIGDLRIELKYG